MYRYCWIVSAAEETALTATFSGFTKICLDRSKIFWGIVAEKNRDCLFLGSLAMIFLISWMNPISSILSASSKTKYFTALIEINPWFIKSKRRPGVATKISMPLLKALVWPCCEPPQKITVVFNLVYFE